MKEQKDMNEVLSSKAPTRWPRKAKRRRLLITASLIIVFVAGGLALLEAEHRSKILGLWPLLIFVPIPLLTWLNSQRAEAKTAEGAAPPDEETGGSST